jgi:hypothetical protein
VWRNAENVREVRGNMALSEWSSEDETDKLDVKIARIFLIIDGREAEINCIRMPYCPPTWGRILENLTVDQQIKIWAQFYGIRR